MNINTEQAYMIFRNDFNGYSYYKIGVSKKSQTGEWINGYIRCQFKKDVVIENKTKIYIRKAWLSFNLNNKETIPYIFISEFETVDETIEKAKTQTDTAIQNTVDNMVKQEQSDPFKDFGEEIQLSDDDLPF
jgi:hypothetical protein